MLCILLLFSVPCLTLHLIVRNKTSAVRYAKKHDASISYEFAFVRWPPNDSSDSISDQENLELFYNFLNSSREG